MMREDMDRNTDDELMAKVGESLRGRAEDLDTQTNAQLNEIRSKVLASLEKPERPWFLQPLYGGALTAAAVLGIAVFNLDSQEPLPALPVFETVLLNSDFEMLSEDLEFYEWLELEMEEDEA